MAGTSTEKDCDSLKIVREAVDGLYDFRDHYFERNDIEKAIQKTEELGRELEKVLAQLDEHKDEIKSKADYLCQRGKAFNVMPEYNEEGLQCLAKAVKLEPKLVEAWNHLGEGYWKKKDVENARNCFTGALNYSKNKVSLRNLSMVLRQLGKTPEEKADYIQKSVQHAKEAVQMDFKDGMSWFIAGNAYLTMFFASGQTASVLKQCMGAYMQAERDPIAKNNPDLHFNRAVAYKYQEDYELALAGFGMASKLDPMWEEAKDKKQQLLEYLENVTELVEAKGKLKNKKLHQLTSSIKESCLGPYSGGSYTSPNGKTVKLKHVQLSSLDEGLNAEKVVVGRVVCSVASEEPIPFTFAIVDSIGACYAVTLYNIAQGQGVIIGDSVAIPEPYVTHINFAGRGDQNIRFSSIRVNSPVVLVVNGKKLGIEKQAPTILTVSAKSE
ncbi:tetratricopeptide repeat protein 5-like [Amphiura filiformis]|uniref:tetratricopeptide repeat protein 5-like n=1 Tax=Amphiura filiformis TaxID=82378 RepID=UPI003B21DE3A